MPKTNAENQAGFRLRMAEAGYKRKEYWATAEEHKLLADALKESRKEERQK